MKSVIKMALSNPTGSMEPPVMVNDRNEKVWSKWFVKRSAAMEQQTLDSGLFRFAAGIRLSPVELRLNGPLSGCQGQPCCCFENRPSLDQRIEAVYNCFKKQGRSGLNGPIHRKCIACNDFQVLYDG